MNNVWWKRTKAKSTIEADPFRRVACRSPFVNKWQGSLAITPTFRHETWAYQLRTGLDAFRVEDGLTHEIVIGYRLLSTPDYFYLLLRGQYALQKNSEAYQIIEGLAFLLLDGKKDEVLLSGSSQSFHQTFWPMAVEKIYARLK